MAESLMYKGSLEGHRNWVTAIAANPENAAMLLTASRDHTIIVWRLERDDASAGSPHKILTGHEHFISDLITSSDGAFCMSASWDKSLRLWNILTGESTRRFVGHTAEVLSVSFSADNRQIVSASADKSIKLWNTLGECKYNITENGHTERITCVRFSPNAANPIIISSGYDKVVKVWGLDNCKLRSDHTGHTGFVNTLAISPDGSLAASGGRDGTTMLWDLNEAKHLYSLDAADMINALIFSPNRYWLAAATDSCIKIFDLETKTIVEELKPEMAQREKAAKCQSLAWSADGQTLFAGYTDNLVRVYSVVHA